MAKKFNKFGIMRETRLHYIIRRVEVPMKGVQVDQRRTAYDGGRPQGEDVRS